MSASHKNPMSSDDFNSDIIEMNVKEETNSASKEDELAEQFLTPIHTTQSSSIYHLVPHLEIKQEEVDFHSNTSKSNSDPEAYCDHEFDRAASISHVDCSSEKAEEKALNDTYLDLLQCARDCETCQRYLTMLSEHIRSTHCPSQPAQDPLYIHPLNVDNDRPLADRSSFTEIKCEVDENIDQMESAQEDSRLNSQSDPDFESQSERESDRDPDYTASPQLTRNARLRGSRSVRKNASSDSKSSKGNEEMSSREEFSLTTKVNSEGSAKSPVSRESTSINGAMGILPTEGIWKCNECEKSFERRVSLTIHMLVHTGEKPFQCDRCEKSFTRPHQLNVHKRMHTGQKLFQCDQCEKSFFQRLHLTNHTKTHTTERLFKCDQCEKSFTQSNHLNSHKRIHTGEKPFQCDQCEKNFTKKETLTRHNRVHTGEKPFQCDECEKSFSQKYNLTTHKTTHTGGKIFRCDQCEKSFTTSNRLTSHKNVHEEFLDLW